MPGSQTHQKQKDTKIDLTGTLENPISSRTCSSASGIARPTAKSGYKETKVLRKSAGLAKSAVTKSAQPQRKSKKSLKQAFVTGDHTLEKNFEVPDSQEHSDVNNIDMFKSRKDRPRHRQQSFDSDEPMPMANASSQSEPETCVVCMCPPDQPKKLEKCGHIFCKSCIDECFSKMNPVCPICGTVYGVMTGNMPKGTMNSRSDYYTQLPGYSGCGTIVIEYSFASGIQTSEHPHPGRPYHGTHRVAYLPDNMEGQKVLRLLRKAFDRRMTFTVGRSATTGLDDQVIWNDVHHKTRVHGGPTSFGYPDPTYLNRVQEELAAKGITD